MTKPKMPRLRRPAVAGVLPQEERMARPRKGDGLLSERLSFRLRPEEIAGLNWAAAQAKLHPADLIRALLRAAIAAGPAYFDNDIEQMQALIRGFNRYGGRLNRLVRGVNQGHAPDPAELRALLNTLGLLAHSAEEYYRAEVRKTVKQVRAAVAAAQPH